VKVALKGAAETLLATLYGRAVDAQARYPVLADPTAVDVVERIDYDFSRLGMRTSDSLGVAIRARLLDTWTRRFLEAQPDATVVHLGCGLDSRVERIDPGPGVRWFDLDQPEVIELREQLYPARAGGYRVIGASVLDPGWLAEIPADLPALVVAEGLTMYLPAAAGPPLLRRMVGHFPRGELAFDTYSRLGVRLQKLVTPVRRSGATLSWGVDDPRDLEREVPGLRLLDGVRAIESLRTLDPVTRAHLPGRMRRQLAVVGRIPGLRDIGHIARYAFG
jgi:O-methyltransferase involved in polyketide biosynthesis